MESKVAGVVGHNSMLAKALIRQLIDAQYDVVTFGRSATADVKFDLGLTQVSELTLPAKLDVIFHCAASFGDDDVNQLGAKKVSELAEATKCKHLVYAGTLNSDTQFEKTLNYYGRTKLEAENTLATYLDYASGTFCSLRFSQLYDFEGMCIKHQPWFARIVTFANEGMTLVLSEQQEKRNFLFVGDAAKAMLSAYENKTQGSIPFVHEQSFTIGEYAEIANDVFSSGGKVVTSKDKAPFKKVNFPSAARQRRMGLDFPLMSFEEAMFTIKRSSIADNFELRDVQ